jgi:murein DD-endopeptidase MepM/ murein hydrolase activator NlpD
VVSERYVIDTPPLKGNSARLGSGWVFVGFDTVGARGYLVNINTGQLTRFPTAFVLQEPPASVFELYPVEVVGVVNLDSFQESETPASEPFRVDTAPFVHWPLPDYARSITCYPDSARTDAQFEVECPGLTTPRTYTGHEGVDIGGKPNGLEIGTPVYTAAPGLVVKQHTGCPSGDITCGDAYGNYVLLEHSRVVGQDVQTWFTGYAHLQTVLVQLYTYIEEIGLPIALSGDTGLGGAHLHFEVRSPQHPTPANWLDPWEANYGLRTVHVQQPHR